MKERISPKPHSNQSVQNHTKVDADVRSTLCRVTSNNPKKTTASRRNKHARNTLKLYPFVQRYLPMAFNRIQAHKLCNASEYQLVCDSMSDAVA
jgi:hypothetical protein